MEEVISTYNNCEYRSCIVMLYATTFADALDKIRTMSEVYQNEKAEKFLEKYNKGRNDNRSYSALEREVKEFIVNSGLINDIEKKQWEHLKDYRDYCAHPVVERDYGLISPNEEQVRMHIRNMFEALFEKCDDVLESKYLQGMTNAIHAGYKKVSNVDDNQDTLIRTIMEEKAYNSKNFILDGHFCVFNTKGDIVRIPEYFLSIRRLMELYFYKTNLELLLKEY